MPGVEAADSERAGQHESGLWSALLTLAAVGFVTALIGFSGSASPTWLLYLVPIILGALTHDVPGGVVASLLSAIAFTLIAPQFVREELAGLVIGFAVFLACGVVVGVQAQRQRHHTRALERASNLDAETDVLKDAHLYARLSEEVRRADRYGHPVGLVIIHVEEFGEFVRVFGRYKAALMLHHMADVLRLSVRNTDIVGRVDETTFAVILLHGDVGRCRVAADRIRAVTLETTYEGDALEPVTSCPTTIAYASYPAEAANQRELVTLAHSRLEDAPRDATRGEVP